MNPSSHMSGMEAMMWQVESDPWLAPSGASLTVYDRPLDFDRLRRSMAHAVAEVPRLRQRVAPGLGRLSTPRWVPDHEFDLDWHLRRIGAPGDGSLRTLLDYFTPWQQDAFDRTRPLWLYVVVDGLANGQGALLTKIHHTIADGEGIMKMARSYTDFEREQPVPPGVDLDAIIAAEPVEDVQFVSTAKDAISQGLKWQADFTRRAMKGMTWPSNLGRMGSDAADLLKTAGDQLHPAGSDLWRERSRRRHAEVLSLPFDAVHDGANRLGGTINDFFLTGAIDAGFRYHTELGNTPEKFHITFVVSTRASADDASNAFTPVPVDVPVEPMELGERFQQVHDLVGAKRAEVHGGGLMSSMAPLANVLPTAVVTGLARDQAGHIDFATSNLPGFRGESFVAGAKTLHSYPFGPVAGTAFNLTMVSMNDVLDLGVNIDPAAVTEPESLTRCLEESYADLLALA